MTEGGSFRQRTPPHQHQQQQQHHPHDQKTFPSPSRKQQQPSTNQPVQADYNWLEGRRYHNVEGASYQLPNDIDEVDRLQLQHFILRYAFQSNYQSPLDKSTVRTILDAGCGPGTWTMEMANEFPEAKVIGIDMSAVFPSTILPSNCQFIQHNLLSLPLPFPDHHFDFVYQRLMIVAYTPEDWTKIMKEFVRITKPLGWIEIVDVDGFGGNNGPETEKLWEWLSCMMHKRGVNMMYAKSPGLFNLMEKAGLQKISTNYRHLPTGEHGGKMGKLLKENEMAFFKAIGPALLTGKVGGHRGDGPLSHAGGRRSSSSSSSGSSSDGNDDRMEGMDIEKDDDHHGTGDNNNNNNNGDDEQDQEKVDENRFTKSDYEEILIKVEQEVETFKSYHIFYTAMGQKPPQSPASPPPSSDGDSPMSFMSIASPESQ